MYFKLNSLKSINLISRYKFVHGWRNCVLTNSNFLTPISLQPVSVNLKDISIKLFDRINSLSYLEHSTSGCRDIRIKREAWQTRLYSDISRYLLGTFLRVNFYAITKLFFVNKYVFLHLQNHSVLSDLFFLIWSFQVGFPQFLYFNKPLLDKKYALHLYLNHWAFSDSFVKVYSSNFIVFV